MKKTLLRTAMLAAVAGGIWAVRDYRQWILLGKGGLPSTPKGWLTMTRWRFITRETRGVAIYEPAIGGATDSVRLGHVPPRNGSRPVIAPHPVPHRQLDQLPGVGMRLQQDRMFDTFVSEHGSYVRYARSGYERHHNGVFVQDASAPLARQSDGEVAHIHPVDGSMHMIFSPSDAKKIVENGWGERHPLAGVRPRIPNTYLLIYAPRDLDELRVVNQFLKAAISHMCACDEVAPAS